MAPQTGDVPSAGWLHCSRTQHCRAVTYSDHSKLCRASTGHLLALPQHKARLYPLSDRDIYIQLVVWPAARLHPWDACVIKVLQACPGCAPAVQTSSNCIESHLRPLVHPVGPPRKQACLSRLSPGPARGCVLLPMNCRPFMEMGSSRLFSLISTLQKSAGKCHMMLAQTNRAVRRREEDCASMMLVRFSMLLCSRAYACRTSSPMSVGPIQAWHQQAVTPPLCQGRDVC